MTYSIQDLATPLPEAVANAIAYGDLSFASSLIASWLSRDGLPSELRRRLELEQILIQRRKNHYIYTPDEAEHLLEKRFPLYRKGMLEAFIRDGLLDWNYVDGRLMLEATLLDNAAKRCDVLLEGPRVNDEDLQLRDDFIARLEAEGCVKTRVSARISLRIPGDGFKGMRAHVNLPLARPVDGRQYDILVEEANPSPVTIDDETWAMRTAVFEKVLEGDDEFSLTFSYTIEARLRRRPEEEFVAQGMDEYLCQELPHIAFTPYLRSLAGRITAGKASPWDKAEAIYDWITSHVRYSFVRHYSTIDCVSEYGALNLKGDCGIQAMLFITLCRIVGIPARWQSGWYVTPKEAGGHDWAEFNVSGQWYTADCSFGGGAYVQGNEKRRRHYFAGLDTLRMIANCACCQPLTGMSGYPRDPSDNQYGEVEVDGHVLVDDLDRRIEVLSYEFI